MKLTRARKTILVTAAVAAVLALAAFPYYSGALLKAASLIGTGDAGAGEDPGGVRAVVSVSGMTCDHCALQVRDALVSAPGVKSADVSYPRGEAAVVYDPDATDPDAIRDAVNATGFRAGEVVVGTTRPPRANLATAFISVEGVSDGTKAAAVRRTLGRIGGVNSAEVSAERSEARVIGLGGGSPAETSVEVSEVKVAYDPALVTPERITAALEGAGFRCLEATFVPPR